MRTFKDRIDAARQLAAALGRFKCEAPLILAIPRGAVPMARVIAEALDADLDVALVHKIGAPGNPEYAIGSVSEFGDVFLSDSATFFDEPYLTSQAELEIQNLKRKRREYTPIHPPAEPRGRTVILVDDGIATGSTMLIAVRALKKRGANRIIVATPVAAVGASSRLKDEVDELVALQTPWDFFGVSQFYDDFSQVTDQEVRETLHDLHPPHGAPPDIAA